MSLRSRLWQWRPELLASGCALAWLVFLGAGPTLNPLRFEWLLKGDWAAYLWGWFFFRNSEWSLPLGATPELLWPHGTSVGFTDANPWASVFFKLLSPVLPGDFQFFGFWLLFCFAAQAVVGVRLARLFTQDVWAQALGGVLLLLTPILPARVGHLALCAIFLVSAVLYLNLKRSTSPREAMRSVVAALVLCLWAAGTHGYLSAMVLTLTFSLCARLGLERSLKPLHALLAAALATVLTFATYLLFGYLGWQRTDIGAEGFGQFSADVFALLNPMGWSRWLPRLPHGPRQGEGFGYLGVGVIGLLLMRFAFWVRAGREAWARLKPLAPLLVAVLAMWVYAWSDHVTFLGRQVLDASWLYAGLSSLTAVFRSSGRFVWPLHLLLAVAAMSAALSLRRVWLSRAVLAVAAALQAAEYNQPLMHFELLPFAALKDPAWASLEGSYRHLQLVPLHLQWVCRFDEALVNRLSYEAYRRKLTFNSANVMRKPMGVERACEQHLAGPLDPQTVYVVDPAFLGDLLDRQALCGLLEGLPVCVLPEPKTPLVEALMRQRIVPRP